MLRMAEPMEYQGKHINPGPLFQLSKYKLSIGNPRTEEKEQKKTGR